MDYRRWDEGRHGPRHPGYRGGGGKRYFGRGGVKYALLQLLTKEPMHGYQMMKLLEEQSGGLYVPSAGSIYPVLQMLEDQGMIASEEAGGKKVYRITELGLSEWNQRPEPPPRPHCGGEGPLTPEEEAYRHERRRRKLGLSHAGYELLQLMSRAERSAAASPELQGKLQQWIAASREQLELFLDADHQSGGEGRGSE